MTLRKMIEKMIISGKIYDLDKQPLEKYLEEEFGDEYRCSSCENQNRSVRFCRGCDFLD